jgi:hypothetical protein
VEQYSNAIKKYANAGDKTTVMQLYRNQLLKDKGNATMLDNATFITERIGQTQNLMKQYEEAG